MMKKTLRLFAVLLMLMAAGCAMTGTSRTPGKTADDEELNAIMAANPMTPEAQQGMMVVDDEFVRTNYQKMKVYDTRRKGEYLESHIPGAVSAPYIEKSGNTADFDSSIDIFEIGKYPRDKNEPVILYCNGNRCWSCYKTAVMLTKAGYKNVYWYRNNGFPGWKDMGLPVEINNRGGSADLPAEREMEFAFVKGGCYMMGDSFGDGGSDERPVHKVCVDDFYMGKYEITAGQWKKVMGKIPVDGPYEDDHPMVKISWQESQQFIKKFNLMTGEEHRLPTEAEWEYAARAGVEKSRYATATGDISHDMCNFDDTAGKDEWIKISPVGSFPPNPLGIFDMCGNVWEWVEDDYDSNAYNKHSEQNPLFKGTGSEQVIRGCGWSDAEGFCRLSAKDKLPPDCPHCNRRNDVGFRLVKSR